tara:strand:+ start:716 stop:3226 length:2511 start_codon:yes stop_codon:yes gene_type:complete
MLKKAYANFSLGIHGSAGSQPSVREVAAREIRNMDVDLDGRLVRRLGKDRKWATQLAGDIKRVIPAYYTGTNELFTTERTHLFVQTTTNMYHWNGSAFTTLTLPTGVTPATDFTDSFSYSTAGGRLFLANGKVTLWVDISLPNPVVYYWGATPHKSPSGGSSYQIDGADLEGMPKLNVQAIERKTGDVKHQGVGVGYLSTDSMYAYSFAYYNESWGIFSGLSDRVIFKPEDDFQTAFLTGMEYNPDPQITHIIIYRSDSVAVLPELNSPANSRTNSANIEVLMKTAPLYAFAKIENKAPIVGVASHTSDQTLDTETLVVSSMNFKTHGVVVGQKVRNTTANEGYEVIGIHTTHTQYDTLYLTRAPQVLQAFSAGDGYQILFDSFYDKGRITGVAQPGTSGASGEESEKLLVDGTKPDWAKAPYDPTGRDIIFWDTSTASEEGHVLSIKDDNSYMDADRFTHTIQDTAFVAGKLYQVRYGKTDQAVEGSNPPFDTAHIAHHAGKLWAAQAKSSTVIFCGMNTTGDGIYDLFPDEDAEMPHIIYINRGDGTEITGLQPAHDGQVLHVLKEASLTHIRGSGVISGMYNVGRSASPVQIDLDASATSHAAGCVAPRSVANVGGDLVYFFARDKQIWGAAGTQIQPVSLSIQRHLNQIPDNKVSEVVSWGYKNKLHVAFTDGSVAYNNRVAVLDPQRKMWTMYDSWNIRDAVWSQGGTDDGVSFAGTTDGFNDYVDVLYTGTTDNGSTFKGSYTTNELQFQQETVLMGVYVYSLTSTGLLAVTVTANNVTVANQVAFTPVASNRYRLGVHARGRVFTIKVEGTGLDLIDRIEYEYQVRGQR